MQHILKMQKMAVSLGHDYNFSCLNCFSLIFTSGLITHYAEQVSKRNLSVLLIVDPSLECNERIRLQAMSADSKRSSSNISFKKDRISCKQCDSTLGFVNREVTRKNEDQLHMYFFRIDALRFDQEIYEILEMVKQKFDQFVEEIRAEKKERRHRRRQRILQLRNAIMQMSSQIFLDSKDRIHFSPSKSQKISFRALQYNTQRNLYPKNLLLSNSFLVISIDKKNPTVTVNPNPKSCLKKSKDSVKKSVLCSIAQATQSKVTNQSNTKCYLRVNLMRVSSYDKIFALRNQLRMIDNSPLRLFHTLFLHSQIHHNALKKCLKRKAKDKSKVQKKVGIELMENQTNNLRQ